MDIKFVAIERYIVEACMECGLSAEEPNPECPANKPGGLEHPWTRADEDALVQHREDLPADPDEVYLLPGGDA